MTENSVADGEAKYKPRRPNKWSRNRWSFSKRTHSIQNSVSIVSPSICHEVMRLVTMILVFWKLTFKPAFSLSFFTFIKRLFSFPLLGSFPLLSPFAVSFYSSQNIANLSHYTPNTHNSVLTIQDCSNFLWLLENDSQFNSSSPWLRYKALTTHFQLSTRHHYLHVLWFPCAKNFSNQIYHFPPQNNSLFLNL